MENEQALTIPLVPTQSSLVSYPDRCALWGDGRYRGNCDGRLFLDLLLRYQPTSVADPMEGSGTTRDVVRWLKKEKGFKTDFWGDDLRRGFNLLLRDLPDVFDFVWIHPPYWNIIQYSTHSSDLSTFESYDEFRAALRVCLERCYAALAPGGRVAVLVGDVRRKGAYYPLVRDVLNLEGHVGQLRAILIKAQHHCRSDTKTYGRLEDPRILHEYCIVFKKDGSSASASTP